MANEWGNNGNSERLFWTGEAPKSLQMVTAAMKLKDVCSLEENMLDIILKRRDITLPTKFRLVKAMVFSSSHVWDMRVGL